MAHAWQVFLTCWHFFGLHIAPWLIIAGIPSLITALTKYPQADGFVRGLKIVLNVLSVLTHKDSPGTLKAPLKMSPPPHAVPPDVAHAHNVVATLLPFFLLPPLLLWMSCGYCLQPAHKDEARCKVIGAVVDCSGPEIQNALAEVLPAVLAAITGHEIDWGALGRLESTHGFALIACAIGKLDMMGQTPPPKDLVAQPIYLLARAQAGNVHANTATYLKVRQLKLMEVH